MLRDNHIKRSRCRHNAKDKENETINQEHYLRKKKITIMTIVKHSKNQSCKTKQLRMRNLRNTNKLYTKGDKKGYAMVREGKGE